MIDSLDLGEQIAHAYIMTLHLLKLCVGIENPDELLERISFRAAQCHAEGQIYEPVHTTRMIPKRKEELLDGGSLYWVMKGQIRARQKLIDIRPFTDAEGISRCHLVLDRELVYTSLQPKRAFQGWRYLKGNDAPSDISGEQHDADMPMSFRQELADLGLL